MKSLLTHSQTTKTVIALGWRNLWRNTRRTTVMLMAITLGIFAMISLTALLRGMIDDMFVRGIASLPGHIQIHHPQYLDDPNIQNRIKQPSGVLLERLEKNDIERWFTRLKVQAVIASERDTRGIELLAINPIKEDITLQSLSIIEGSTLTAENDSGIIIGKRLADKLETKLGWRLVITSQDPDNNLVDRGFRITGIYQAEMRNLENYRVFATLPVIQQLLNVPNEVTETAIFLHNGTQATQNNAVVKSLNELINTNLQQAKPWQLINPILGSYVKFMDSFVLIWILVVFIAMAFGLANTLTMSVFERVREIGLMMALGMKPNLIRWQIIIETSFLLAIGILAGNLIAFAVIYSLSDGIDLSSIAEGAELAGISVTLKPSLLLSDVLTANICVLILGIFTCLLPAWRASAYKPIQALRAQN